MLQNALGIIRPERNRLAPAPKGGQGGPIFFLLWFFKQNIKKLGLKRTGT